jgi:hypothetical protein
MTRGMPASKAASAASRPATAAAAQHTALPLLLLLLLLLPRFWLVGMAAVEASSAAAKVPASAHHGPAGEPTAAHTLRQSASSSLPVAPISTSTSLGQLAPNDPATAPALIAGCRRLDSGPPTASRGNEVKPSTPTF